MDSIDKFSFCLLYTSLFFCSTLGQKVDILKINTCPLCGGNHLGHAITCTDHYASGEQFTLVRCDDCGFIFTQGVPCLLYTSMVVKKGTPFLYNLATDIHEDHDIAAGHPDIVKQMKEIIKSQHTPNPNFFVTLPSFE